MTARRRGTTLVEILVAVALAVAVIGLAVFTFNAMSGMNRIVAADADAALVERRLVNQLDQDARLARSLAAAGSTLELERPIGRGAMTGEIALAKIAWRVEAFRVVRREGSAEEAYEFFPRGKPGATLETRFELLDNRLRLTLAWKTGPETDGSRTTRDFGLPALAPEGGDWKTIDEKR